MTDLLSEINNLIKEDNIDKAEIMLQSYLKDPQNQHYKDKAFYMLGNIYRKKGDWQKALNNYMEAISLNPNSPAVEAKNMLMDILNFYNKDMYNQ